MWVRSVLSMTSLLGVAISSAVANPAIEPGYENRSRDFSFALVADSPYGDDNIPAFQRVIEDINGDTRVKLVMHAGDIKSGSTKCSDERIRVRFEQIQTIKPPVIYTPGDNEWTDCHRPKAGRFNPVERLAFLRKVFFPVPGQTLGISPMAVTTQAKSPGFKPFVENVMFEQAGVVFSTQHLVGSNNNLKPWSGIDAKDSAKKPRAERLAEYQQRNAASLDWLDKTFARAKSSDARGVVIMIHANPNIEDDFTSKKRAGFNDYLNKLFALTADFNKPVLLLHGDKHVFFVDKPKLVPWYKDGDALTADRQQQFLPNLSRVQGFGDTPQHWVKITINSEGEELFSVVPQIVEGNL